MLTRSPLRRLLEIERIAEREMSAMDSDDEKANRITKLMEEYGISCDRIAAEGRLERCLVEILRRLTALRFLRESDEAHAPAPSDERSFVRGIHVTLNGVPGVLPEPPADTNWTIADEIAHLDAVLKAVDDAIATQPVADPLAEDDIDGPVTLEQFGFISQLAKSTLEKRKDKPQPLEPSRGRRPAKFSYLKLREWLAGSGLKPAALPPTYREAMTLLAKMSS
jgi:hypothetical protein